MKTMNQHPKVIIQILHFRDINDTLECLESVFKLNYPNHSVLVIDNSGKEVALEKDLEQLYKQDRINLIKTDENKGFAGGHNIGFAFSIEKGADYIWALNNDTVVVPDALSKLVENIETDSKIAAASPVIYYYGTEKVQILADVFNPKSKFVDSTDSFEQLEIWERENRPFCLLGTALLLRASALKEVGFFDERFFAYLEDIDLSRRILNAGFKTKVIKEAKIYHKDIRFNENSRHLRAPYYYFFMARNRLLFLKKHCTPLQFCLSLRYYLLLTMERLAACAASDDKAYANALLDGIYCGLIGRRGPWAQDVHMPEPAGNFLKLFAWPLYRLLRLLFPLQ